MPISPNDDLMTVAEIATALRLNQATIRNWIDAGKLPALRIGKRRADLSRRRHSGRTTQRDAGESC
jgi:excisionase family DNA binding protein